jgi:hypothetical protein
MISFGNHHRHGPACTKWTVTVDFFNPETLRATAERAFATAEGICTSYALENRNELSAALYACNC